MFVYLSKRIAIPNGTVVTALGWNEEQGWLACGGAGGLLKVLKVDGGKQGQKTGGLSLNQTLEGHEATVSLVAWNQVYRKLTSCDETGRIIVWTLHKGMWFEEMVNNRNKSRVVDLSWNSEGTRICIAYADGTVIIGGVDGNRLWGREYEKELSRVCWSADDNYIMFGTPTGEVLVHDATTGHHISQLNIQCETLPATLCGLYWHPAWVERPEPLATFAVCYTSGKLQLMESIGDDKPYVIDTGMPLDHIAWNPQGTVLAVCGVAPTATVESPVVVTQFFSNEGVHLRTLRVSGKYTGGITWEGDGLRVAIAVDSSVYFANVRPDYKYCYFKKTVVFAFNRPDKVEDSVMFWNIRTNERTFTNMRGLISLSSCKDACTMVMQPDPQRSQCIVQLLDAIGSPIDTKIVDMDPYVCDMNSSHVVCCGEENIFLWQFRDPSVVVDDLDPVSVQASRSESHERVIHIDDIVRRETEPTMHFRSALTNDLICAVCMNEEYLYIGRESGLLHIYSLNTLQLRGKLTLPSRPQSLALNCDGTSLIVVDLGGLMNLFPIDKEKFSLVPRPAEALQNMERKDVWGVCWASDDPETFAIMEKTRMHLFRKLEQEEPVQSNANLCKFKSLKVRSLQFDDLMQDPERPRKENVVDFESKALRDAREMLSTVSMRDAYTYMDENPHPKLWRLLAEHALSQLEFSYAEMAFVRYRDYPSIQFVKRIKAMDDPKKQLAEVHAYYHRLDEAEKIYAQMDRKDLALELRNRFGDWFGVVRLVQEGGGDTSLQLAAWESIGDHYANHQKWSKAIQYYQQCRNFRKLAGVFYDAEDFEMLEQLVTMVEHDRELLNTLGTMFLSVGLADEASRAFLAAGEVRRAVDGCVALNSWDRALALAQEHKLEDVEQILNKYANYLKRRERLPEAIELYRKAGKHDEAAKILAQLAARAAESDALRAKKFYVLSALEVEKYRSKKITLGKDGTEAVDEMLHTDHSAVSERALDAAWRGAEAYHFYLMCQQQIQERNAEAALVLAMRLTEYDDMIAPVDSYSLIALTSYLAGNFGICSKAFTRLETAEVMDDVARENGGVAPSMTANFSMDLDVTQRTMANSALGSTVGGGGDGNMVGSSLGGTTTSLQLTNPTKGVSNASAFTFPTVSLQEGSRRFAQLAINIFTKHRPIDTSVSEVRCAQCGTQNKEWVSYCAKCQQRFDTCIVTGRVLSPNTAKWQCHVCRHKANETDISCFKCCPLCHTTLKKRMMRWDS